MFMKTLIDQYNPHALLSADTPDFGPLCLQPSHVLACFYANGVIAAPILITPYHDPMFPMGKPYVTLRNDMLCQRWTTLPTSKYFDTHATRRYHVRFYTNDIEYPAPEGSAQSFPQLASPV